MLRELEDTSADSGSLAEAAFWRVQQEVLLKQQQLVAELRAEGKAEG